MRDSLFFGIGSPLTERKKRKNVNIRTKIWFQSHIWHICFLLSYSAQCNWRLVPVLKIEGQVTHIMCHTSLPPTEPIYDQCPALTFFLGLSCISFACFMFETELSNIKSESRIHSSKSQYNKFLASLVGLSCSEKEKRSTRKARLKSHYKHIKCLCCAFFKAFGATSLQLSYKWGYVNWHYGEDTVRRWAFLVFLVRWPWKAHCCLCLLLHWQQLLSPPHRSSGTVFDLRRLGFKRIMGEEDSMSDNCQFPYQRHLST